MYNQLFRYFYVSINGIDSGIFLNWIEFDDDCTFVSIFHSINNFQSQRALHVISLVGMQASMKWDNKF